jgi:hypothetical protein
MTRFFLCISLLSILLLQSFSNSKDKCSVDKLYGDWIYIAMHTGRLAEIEDFKKDDFKGKSGPPIMTYKKNGTYINFEGDYSTNGKFMTDAKKCIIKEFDDNGKKGDTLTFEIMRLDSQYLLIATIGAAPTSYFYKRK